MATLKATKLTYKKRSGGISTGVEDPPCPKNLSWMYPSVLNVWHSTVATVKIFQYLFHSNLLPFLLCELSRLPVRPRKLQIRPDLRVEVISKERTFYLYLLCELSQLPVRLRKLWRPDLRVKENSKNVTLTFPSSVS